LLSAIVESSGDAIVRKTLEGIIISWNRAAESMFGYSAAEAVGQSIRLIIPDDRQEEEDKIFSQIRRGEKVDHFETVRQTKDGRKLDVSLTVSPIRDSSGRVVGASKVARDITESKRLQHQTEGWGLGLWITKRIIEAHGGTVQAESCIGKGSVFTIRLPLPPSS
jgi:PAS domain S-box-containing protein